MLKMSLNKISLFTFLKRFPKNVFIALLICCVSIVLLRVENIKSTQRILGLQTQAKLDQKTIEDWQQILLERPDYRDGWIQLATSYFQLGDKENALAAILKAKELDPTNTNILSFEKFIRN